MGFPMCSVKKVVTCSRSRSGKGRTKANIFQVLDCHHVLLHLPFVMVSDIPPLTDREIKR